MAKIKRLFNDPYDIVEEMVEGYVGAHKQYVKMCDLDEAQGRVVLANDAGTKDKVGVIIGGGSGHEPLFIGYVGEDFADAVVIGNINTSPSPDPCYAAAKACDNGKGCIYLYGNYAGDVMNFDMGAEKADEEDDIRVETVAEELSYMKKEFFKLPVILYDGAANYLFFQTPGITDLDRRLESYGIMIRNCSNYVNLGKDYWRVAVKSHEENEKLIKALRMILKGEE